MSDPLRFEWQSTPACWSCYYDPEGPSGMGNTRENALLALFERCDSEHEGQMLAGAIVAAIDDGEKLRTALINYRAAFANKGETTSLHEWNRRLQSADADAGEALAGRLPFATPETSHR